MFIQCLRVKSEDHKSWVVMLCLGCFVHRIINESSVVGGTISIQTATSDTQRAGLAKQAMAHMIQSLSDREVLFVVLSINRRNSCCSSTCSTPLRSGIGIDRGLFTLNSYQPDYSVSTTATSPLLALTQQFGKLRDLPGFYSLAKL